MAATRLIALHVNKGKTVGQCLSECLDYSQNPIKTEQGELADHFLCLPAGDGGHGIPAFQAAVSADYR